jgi:hypothetical protein
LDAEDGAEERGNQVSAVQTKLTRIILGEGPAAGEAPVKHKEYKRMSVTFYRNRCRKGWATRKRVRAAREAALASAEAERNRKDAA